MEIKAPYTSQTSLKTSSNPYTQEGKESIKEEAQKLNANTMMMEYTLQFQLSITSLSQGNLSSQSAMENPFKLNNILSGIDYDFIGYTGKPINELSQEEAKELISEEGYFGIKQTSERLAEFVIQGSGGDLDLLQKGREGIVRGYEQAEKLWGDKLPDISQQTLAKALEKIDKVIAEKGGNALSVQA
ncbi:hydrogenase-4 component G [Wolinella succinogenes]|uniref:hydrogenase-4 component G n=1 Tax=Wolinella succinogenes TaxID=844 RepID=UPI0024090D90|nr:hydrogenase-4 component G [Wolinella succinogenes]